MPPAGGRDRPASCSTRCGGGGVAIRRRTARRYRRSSRRGEGRLRDRDDGGESRERRAAAVGDVMPRSHQDRSRPGHRDHPSGGGTAVIGRLWRNAELGSGTRGGSARGTGRRRTGPG
ncbi:hypothetical protein ACFFX0_08875 [Citricoccus parietis]|uniref:Uncharacterized protein n=1 Tax=Citricoccus parietis TaxID=592307 RepID=A0ABV5FX96_9MICC